MARSIPMENKEGFRLLCGRVIPPLQGLVCYSDLTQIAKKMDEQAFFSTVADDTDTGSVQLVFRDHNKSSHEWTYKITLTRAEPLKISRVLMLMADDSD